MRELEILERQKAAIVTVLSSTASSPEMAKWTRDTEIAIERIFGPSSRNISDFKAIGYSPGVYYSGMPDSDYRKALERGLARADAVLASMIDELKEYGLANDGATLIPAGLPLIERICLGFHTAARQLRSRYSQRPTLEIEDEYDVQDLLHAFLRLHFDDVRAEEWNPSYAGRSSRCDFLIKDEKIVVEVKKTRPSMKAGDLGEELIIDIARYERHPDCESLVCFVYDPEGRIGNPAGLEKDLEDIGGRLRVRVIIAPK